jgi:hypothetical protein
MILNSLVNEDLLRRNGNSKNKENVLLIQFPCQKNCEGK